MLIIGFTFCLSVLVGLVGTRLVRNTAETRGWVSGPASRRHIHKRPVARLGGVAIITTCYGVVAAMLLLAPHVQLSIMGSIRPLVYLGTAGAAIFLVGLYDDIRSLRPWIKLLLEACAGAVLYMGGFRIEQIGVWSQHSLTPLSGLAATIGWILLITNAFNLIDGMDGLAAGSALISTLGVGLLSVISHDATMALVTAALAGSLIGFLRFNFNPATIFLGDCGSLFIGFMLASISLSIRQKAPTLVAVAIPMAAFGLPLVEVALSVFRRLLSGRSPFSPDRDHMHHRLLRAGLSQRKAVCLLYAVSGLCVLLSLFLILPEGKKPGLAMLAFGVTIIVFVHRLRYAEFSELHRVAQRALEQRQVMVNDLAIRHATEELRACDDLDSLLRILISAFSANAFDSFGFRINPLVFIESRMISSYPKNDGQIHFTWRRNENARDCEWHLSMNMLTSDEKPCGVFTVGRATAEKPLLFDVNLLSVGFRTALADAMDRAVRNPSIQPIAATHFFPARTGSHGPTLGLVLSASPSTALQESRSLSSNNA